MAAATRRPDDMATGPPNQRDHTTPAKKRAATGTAFALATIYFTIWPSPLGDPRSWDEIFHVPPPPQPDEEPEQGAQNLDDDRSLT